MSRITTRTVTVANGAQNSAVIRNTAGNAFAFSLPGAITGTAITVSVGLASDALLTLKGDNGDDFTIIPDGAGLYLFPEVARRFEFLRISTGTNEAAARTITVYYQNG